MPLGQICFSISIFSQSFRCNENCIDIFQVSPVTVHVDSKFLTMVKFKAICQLSVNPIQTL